MGHKDRFGVMRERDLQLQSQSEEMKVWKTPIELLNSTGEISISEQTTRPYAL